MRAQDEMKWSNSKWIETYCSGRTSVWRDWWCWISKLPIWLLRCVGIQTGNRKSKFCNIKWSSLHDSDGKLWLIAAGQPEASIPQDLVSPLAPSDNCVEVRVKMNETFGDEGCRARRCLASDKLGGAARGAHLAGAVGVPAGLWHLRCLQQTGAWNTFPEGKKKKKSPLCHWLSGVCLRKLHHLGVAFFLSDFCFVLFWRGSFVRD